MKTQFTISLLAAAACGLANAQTAYTTPVGYTTQTLAANTTNLVGFNVLKPVVASGSLTGVSGAVLSDSAVDFSTALTANKTYILEVTSGTAAGTVQEFVTWSQNSITLPATVTGLAIGNAYAIRIAPTLQETFPVGFLAGSLSATNADKVWVPTGPGTYIKYWYKTSSPAGWCTTTTGLNNTGAVTADVPLISIDGIMIEKKGTAKDLVLTGEVKKTGSNILLGTGLNLISINPPSGLTLFTAGLQGDIAGSLSATNADIVWVRSGSGYTKYWYKTSAPAGWCTTTTGVNNTGAVSVDVALPASVFIQRKGSAKVVTLDVPTSYSSL
jgi:hypothetical protein